MGGTNKPTWEDWFSWPMFRVTVELLGTVMSKPYLKSRSAARRNPAMSWGLYNGPTLAMPGIYALLAVYITSL